ncbi:SusC/RagA family TonB-linked outer membrane protein [Puteibacter caeruleilacunae]|nr:SusC/RagA family TonB-linked outer membrane protein [Puteibacter caeruleilacunae]
MFLIMWNFFILFFVLNLTVTANALSQKTVSLDLKDVTLKTCIRTIEQQTGMGFLYNGEELRRIKGVTINVTNKKVDEVLDEILRDSGYTYRIQDEVILVKKNELPKVVAQNKKHTVKGKVTDSTGAPLPGVTVMIVGSTSGVITDPDGMYEFAVEPTDKLNFSFIGMASQEIDVNGRKNINVVLQEKASELEDVTIVAFGKQKKESVISSIETVKTDELRVPSSNLTTALAGRMSGMISYQTTGEPGEDNANFFIRGVSSFGTGKVDPLILIDNVEVSNDDLSRLHPDDIQSFSILKDATATALYGARGANGVILVSTKEGKEGKTKISIRIENSFSSPTKEIDMADPITYMMMGNEAIKTRNPLGAIPYSNEKIEFTKSGLNSFVYPSVDWMDMLFKNVAINQRANINISGGGKVARYYIAASVAQDNGILDIDKKSDFNSNINLTKYLIRSNININLSKSTEAIVRVHGTFDDYSGPLKGGSTLYRQALNVSPVRFPAYYEPDEKFNLAQHTLFGNAGDGTYLNPYAEMLRGYKEKSKTVMLAQFELKQDLSQWIDGLRGRLLFNTTRNSYFDLSRKYNPFYYTVQDYDKELDTYELFEINPDQGTEYLSYEEGDKKVSSSIYTEAALMYDKNIDDHTFSGMLVFIARNTLNGNAGSLAESLPARNLGLSGRFTYAWKDRYLTEFNFGYNGSEKFDKDHRWGFFPSIGVAWNISKEKWWNGRLAEIFSKLKMKGTYGLAGNDDIGDDRFFYLSDVEIRKGGSYTFGSEFSGQSGQGVRINNYANSEIGWEIAYKSNIGFEIGLFDNQLEIQTDLFHETRTNILQERSSVPSSMGLWDTPLANIGEAESNGFECSLDYNQSFNKDLWITARANFTYARGTFKKYEEPDYHLTTAPYRSKVGQPISQKWGYVAERLFIDDADIANSPRQDLGEYQPGDLKYRDLSGDGVINELDMAPIGYPTVPEINYGFGASVGYKNLDFSFFMQGSARSSFWIDPKQMSPFVKYSEDGRILERGLAKFIADDYWSEASQDPYASWPRLSDYKIDNNNVRSTFFMQDGAFLRLKSAEIGYSIPKSVVKRAGIDHMRFYVSGSNLLLISGFDHWDIEMGGNGLKYPLQRVVNLGLNITL